MRGEDDGGLQLTDLLRHFLDGRRGEGGGGGVARAAGLHHLQMRGDFARLHDLRPAVGEPAVADHKRGFAMGELARHRLHREGAAAGDDGDAVRAVNLFQAGVDVAHGGLEPAAHVVERTVGEDDGIFQQAVGIDVRQKGVHWGLPLYLASA